MPKVRPLTAKQAADQEDKKLSDAILNVVKERKGRDGLREGDLSKRIDISSDTWRVWRKQGLERVQFKSVLALVRFAGYELKLEKRREPRNRNKAVKISKDDSYGVIIEGFIRQIVLETMDEYEK